MHLSPVEQLCIDCDYITDNTDSVTDYDYNYCLLQRRPDACSTRQAVDRARSIRKDHRKGRNSWQASGATACKVLCKWDATLQRHISICTCVRICIKVSIIVSNNDP